MNYYLFTPKSPKGDFANTNGLFAVSKSPLGDLGVKICFTYRSLR